MIEDQRVARDRAIDHVGTGSAFWRTYTRGALYECAGRFDDLTSDDVWAVLHRNGIPDPREPRAMGPVMLAGVREGWIKPTNQVRISDDPASPNHRRPQRVYLSLIPKRAQQGTLW